MLIPTHHGTGIGGDPARPRGPVMPLPYCGAVLASTLTVGDSTSEEGPHSTAEPALERRFGNRQNHKWALLHVSCHCARPHSI